jgi:hypothetical protein
MRSRREVRDLHALTDDGMLLCNPRDREAAHRAQVQGIVAHDVSAVTCRKCRVLLRKPRVDDVGRVLVGNKSR